MYIAHNYETMTTEKRPQDEYLDGRDWKFETLEHAGEIPDCFPNAIKGTDSKGRSCIYVAITLGGKVVDSKGYVSSSTENKHIVFDGG